jgi:hypothetical protein
MSKILNYINFFFSLFSVGRSNKYFIKSIEGSYLKHRKEFPGYEPHFYLAQVWLAYMQSRGADINDEYIKTAAMDTTFLVACTPPSKCARALGIFLLYRERPEIFKPDGLLTKEFNEIIVPVLLAQEDGTVMNLYRKYNPKMAANMSSV